ncbi:putative Rho-associated protein kinase [Aspergillus saccharolyticus JOP 1030-1]|uniref:Protein kinase domain-containing protein n=1 Tax=Aspergillus saccharolyticus JOP 1030-1 TaxID=1450539 RepID=A0A318ZRJ0_9EURO|nr:hypothetical protein BP01DRAFT_414870 [Aspergillus saccharolyticus JOP 1030-1]PYH46983.1 hypothetical protein BP01DRAFT_414870 [Aspergillus saccharolyticus JOP 1030-1]
MDIVHKNEAFERIDGKMKFAYVQVFVKVQTNDKRPISEFRLVRCLCERPSILFYVGGTFEKQIACEVETCEILGKNPHPNIAINYGYKENQKVGFLDAIKHLHAHGLVHDDISPANIAINADGTLVLIDFDGCRYIGESLRDTQTKRTHHWHDLSVGISLEKPGVDAFRRYEHGWLDRRTRTSV